MRKRRFDLKNIETALNEVRVNFDAINAQLEGKRERMTPDLVTNIVEAYAYLNGLLEKGIDLFSPAGWYSILELNHIVLCGTDPGKRFEFHRHITETRTRFQENVSEVKSWYKDRGRDLKPHRKATEFYSIALSQPQLFIEGNHRTENIVLNYLLICEDAAPFVLDLGNAQEYFNLSTLIKFSDRHSLLHKITKMSKYQEAFKELLKQYGNWKYIEE